MIIHQPEISKDKDHVIISSRIQPAKKCDGFPDYLWYRIPEQYSKFISLHSNAFLVATLSPAMFFGENIKINGAISPRLAYHLDNYQYLLELYFPNLLQKIEIDIGNITPLQASPKATAIPFSGGVDAFYTLQKHISLPQSQKEYRPSHALFINGFDIVNDDKFNKLFLEYQKMLMSFNIDLIPLKTNQVNLILPWLPYQLLYSQVLISSAMILGGLIKRFIISSSWTHAQYKKTPVNADPLTDPLLSTDTLDIIHFGADKMRAEKIEQLHLWTPAQKQLRVCGSPQKGSTAYNCSRCEKCLRTMIPLYALGSLKHFKLFSKPITSNRDILWWARKFNPETGFVKQTFYIVKKHKAELLPWLWLAAGLGYTRYWAIRLLPTFIKKALRRFGYFIDIHEDGAVFDDPAIIQLLQKKNQNKFDTLD